jgi:hypothetical protein
VTDATKVDRQEDFNREIGERVAKVETGLATQRGEIADVRTDMKAICKEVRGIKYCLLFLSGALLTSQGPLAELIHKGLFS